MFEPWLTCISQYRYNYHRSTLEILFLSFISFPSQNNRNKYGGQKVTCYEYAKNVCHSLVQE